jgi:hypothetical protein
LVIVFSLSLNSWNFLISFLISSIPTGHWAMYCSVSNYLHIFCCYFFCWVLVLLYCDQIACRGLLQFSCIWWHLLYFLKCDLF